MHDCAWDKRSKKFVTAGKSHIYFWDAEQQGLAKKKGLLEGHEDTQFVAVTWCDGGFAWAGGSNGKLYKFAQDGSYHKCMGSVKGHQGFISSIRFAEGKLFTGAKDMKIQMWDNLGEGQDYACGASIQLDSLVRAIDCKDGNIVAGMRDGTIAVMGSDGSGRNDVMKSHDNGEVWGLAMFGDSVITSADDNKVMVWNPDTRKNEKCFQVSSREEKARKGGASTLSRLADSQCSRCVAVHADWVAVAGNDGAVSIRSRSDPGTETKLLKDSSEWIEVMAFSPDGTMLAVGSHDNSIYVYNVGTWDKKGECTGHSSYIMALDWCTHSKYIRSNCGAYELLFFTIDENGVTRDPDGRSNTVPVQWATTTCKMLWQTQGIYPRGTDGTHVNSVCGSTDGQLLATGDDYGLVNLFNDPCLAKH
jgi:WD40 repeat protein